MVVKIVRIEESPCVLPKTFPVDSVKVTDITKRIMLERDSKLSDDPVDAMRVECGYVWEELLRVALKARWEKHHPPIDYAGVKPEYRQIDGVWMGPDHFDLNDEYPLHEFKATKVSSRNYDFPSKHWYWLMQIQAYCWGYGVQKAKLILWHINGDYTWEAKTLDINMLRDVVPYCLEFTRRELRENWQMLLQYARKYNLIPPVPQFTKEQPCRETPPLQPEPTTRKSSGSNPPTKSRKARIVTFPPTKRK